MPPILRIRLDQACPYSHPRLTWKPRKRLDQSRHREIQGSASKEQRKGWWQAARPPEEQHMHQESSEAVNGSLSTLLENVVDTSDGVRPPLKADQYMQDVKISQDIPSESRIAVFSGGYCMALSSKPWKLLEAHHGYGPTRYRKCSCWWELPHCPPCWSTH